MAALGRLKRQEGTFGLRSGAVAQMHTLDEG
jgi:hypothetical protein